MFTGIVECIGSIKRIQRSGELNHLIVTLKNKDFLLGVQVGDSILVNGICLTVTKLSTDEFTVEYMPETERVTTIKDWKPGKALNLEKSLRPNRGLDGHIVQGHIDGTGRVKSFIIQGNERELTITTTPEVLKYLVKKGAVAIDGISLTISEVTSRDFRVNIISHTVDITNLKLLKPNHQVNIETDIIGKYVEKFINKEK